MVSLVFHDQEQNLAPWIEAYRTRLRDAALDDIPFHMVDLLHGHGDYEGIEQEKRKRQLVAFGAFVRKLPVTYRAFRYSPFDIKDAEHLGARIAEDIRSLIDERLGFFQSFDRVVIYYDGGQKAVSAGLRRGFQSKLASDIAQYKKPVYQSKRLAQAADYFCSIELAADRYASGTVSNTYGRFFGSWKMFRSNYLKQVRRKLF